MLNLRKDNTFPEAVGLKKGSKVTYFRIEHTLPVPVEHGIVKEIRDEKHAFVVFNCDNNWEQFDSYTSQLTPISHLINGWIKKDESGQYIEF